jgi:hypothetical protein
VTIEAQSTSSPKEGIPPVAPEGFRFIADRPVREDSR